MALAASRAVRRLIRMVRPGGGSSIPGRVAAFIAPDLVTNALLRLEIRPILVTGSAGKSTTTKLLVDTLGTHGLRVFTNPSTSNIRQGFFSAVLTACDWRGRLSADIAVIEIDEGHGLALANAIQPQLTVFTNVMSDQLDRFVDPEMVADKLRGIAAASQAILINADDQNLLAITENYSRAKYSVSCSEQVKSAAGYPGYAYTDLHPSDTTELVLSVADVSREEVTLIGTDDQPHRLRLVAPGAHMGINTACAIGAAKLVLGSKFDWRLATDAMATGSGVFARWETVMLRGFATQLVLVQNPGSFQINLDLVEHWPERIFFGIGKDVHDPSWLWTVDVSRVPRIDVVAGFNAHEAFARFMTDGVIPDVIEPDIPRAVDRFLELPVTAGGSRIMFITADAMRRARRHLRLAK